ncbi:MAG: caspase family protein [Armatimonadota bacterium]
MRIKVYLTIAAILAGVCALSAAQGQTYKGRAIRFKPAGAPTMRLKAPAVSQSTAVAQSKGTLFSDSFEGTFPGSWYFYGDPHFGLATNRHVSGTHSIYCSAGGNGAVAAPGPYPSNFQGWITYGPFSLAGVTSGKVQFKLWNAPGAGDEVFAGWSLNDVDYQGFTWTGNSGGWIDADAAMDGYVPNGPLMPASYLGEPTVYFSLYYSSDTSANTSEGAYVDDVSIVTSSVYTGGIAGTVKTSNGTAIASAIVSAGTASTATSATGQYSFNLAPGTYTVKAAKTGYTFTPTSKSVTVASAVVTTNFVGASTTGGVAGIVKTSTGAVVKGAVVTAGSSFAYTDALGKYSLSLKGGAYAVTVHKPGYKFTPASASITVVGSTIAKNFTASKWTGDGVVNHWAVSVGIATFKYINNLNYCDDDARDMTAALKAGGFPAANIKQLIDSQATKAAIKSAIAWMATQADADDVCVFFQSSHGDQGPDVAPFDEASGNDEYLCPYDTNSSRTTEIRDDELGQWMAALKTTKYVVLIDACYAGGLIKSVGTASSPGFGSGFARALNGMSAPGEMNTKDLDDLGSGVVIASCTDLELSEESSSLKNGVFAYYVVQGMSNNKPDTNKNGFYSAEEIYNYAKGPVHTYNPTQTLVMYDGYSGQLDFAKSKTVVPTSTFLAVSGTAAATKSGSTAIVVSLSAAANVSASVLNLAGREVALLGSKDLDKGTSTLLWSGKSKLGTTVPAGQYLVRLQAKDAAGNSASCLLSLRK